MSKNVIVLLAEGFEEVEAITPIDYLRRARINVTTAALEGLAVKGAHGIIINADTTLHDLVQSRQTDVTFWNAVIIPGGMPGAANVAASNEAGTLITHMADTGRLVCAICAAPAVVLAPLGLLAGKKFTCYPGMEERAPNGKCKDDKVVIDDNIITSRSAGTSGAFAVAIIGQLLNHSEADTIARAVLL